VIRAVALAAATSACGRVDFDPIEPLLQLEFDGDVRVDSSPFRRAATCTACPTLTAGRVGTGAGAFDGTQCLHVGDAPELRPRAWTITAWFRTSDTSQLYDQILARPYFGDSTTADAIGLFTNDQAMVFAQYNEDVIGAPFAVGAWHHAAGTFEAGTLSLYFDGALVASQSFDDPQRYADDQLAVGCDIDQDMQHYGFIGSLDDVRLYGFALDSSEIAALAQ
jgi:hypothetical protein